MKNDFQYDAPRAGLMPEPDGSYIVDQQKAALLDAYYQRQQLERSFFDDDDEFWQCPKVLAPVLSASVGRRLQITLTLFLAES